MKKTAAKLFMTNEKIKEQRGLAVAEDMFFANERTIRAFEDERRVMTRRLATLNDFHVDSELSLKVVNDTFDATEWDTESQAIGVALMNNEIELKVAKARRDQFFSDETPETL